MKIIVGLGNPGEKYINTRHNVGFMILDALAKELNLTWKQDKKFNAEICEVSFPLLRKERDRVRFILIKPLTFINNSGQSVQAVMSYYNLLPKKLGIVKKKDSNLSNILTIIHDDLDIELGKTKESTDSRSAGHKGVQSIINHLKTKNFKRIRIGIKTDLKEKMPADKFVLMNFNKDEQKIINKIIIEIKNNLLK